MHPILGGLTDKVLLFSTSGAVTLDRVSFGAHEVIQLGQLHYKGIVVVLEEGLRLQACGENRSEIPASLFLGSLARSTALERNDDGDAIAYIVLLDDLLEAGIVELGELGQIMHVGNDVTQVLFEEQEILIAGRIFSSLQARDYLVHFSSTGLDATDDLIPLELLEGEDLVELSLQQSDETLLIVLRPRFAIRLGILLRGRRDVLCLQGLLEIIVGDVVPCPLLDQGRPQLLPESAMAVRSACRVGMDCD